MTRIVSFLNRRANFIVFVILFFSVLWSCRFLLSSDCFYSHDLDYNLARGYEAVQSIKLGNIPLRWSGNINNGCGAPVFNFFYPLGYYLLALFYFLLGSILLSWKVLIFICLFLGSWFFYLWAKKITGDPLASFLGSFIYLFAPYRFLLVFVRGSLEFLSYAIFPILLFIFSVFLREKNRNKEILYLFFASLVGALFFLSHNIVVMLMFPIFLAILFLDLWSFNFPRRKIFLSIFSILTIFGLSSFFIGPALVEKKYVKLGHLNIVNYADHFPTLGQIIRSKWGYFFSVPGENDGMSFMLGYAQWLVLLISTLAVFYLFFVRKNSFRVFLREYFWVIFYFLLSTLFIFLILSQSNFVWNNFIILQQIQYPWRLLGVLVFLISALSSYLFSKLKKGFFYWLFLFFIFALAIFGNRNHLRVFDSCQGKESLYKDFSNLYVSWVGT
ncbi:MAG: hypothetical protein ACPLXL_01505, partial [Minisyncoccia bacterium]